MRKPIALILIALGVVCMLISPSAAKDNDDHKITICHRTNSDTNPYVQITVDKNAADGADVQNGPDDHYGEHQGPIWNDTLKDQKIEWGDIIPPIEGYHNGLNWTAEGQAIYRNGCDVPGEITTTTTVDETTTTTEPTTTTVEETTTTTLEETTTTVGLDGSSTVPKRTLGPAAAADTLPVTGSETTFLMALGVSLLLAGTALSVRYR